MEVLTHKMMTQSFSELDAVALEKMKAGLQRADNALEGFQQSVAVEDNSVHLELVAYLHMLVALRREALADYSRKQKGAGMYVRAVVRVGIWLGLYYAVAIEGERLLTALKGAWG